MDHDEAQSKPIQTGPVPAVPMSGDDAGPKRIGHAGIFRPARLPLLLASIPIRHGHSHGPG